MEANCKFTTNAMLLTKWTTRHHENCKLKPEYAAPIKVKASTNYLHCSYYSVAALGQDNKNPNFHSFPQL